MYKGSYPADDIFYIPKDLTAKIIGFDSMA